MPWGYRDTTSWTFYLIQKDTKSLDKGLILSLFKHRALDHGKELTHALTDHNHSSMSAMSQCILHSEVENPSYCFLWCSPVIINVLRQR